MVKKQTSHIWLLLCALAAINLHAIMAASTPKKAIVIGASSGIGRAIAHELASHHHIVGITARRVPLLKELQNEFPGQIYTRFMDVTHPHQAQNIFMDLIHEMGNVDLVVINAGLIPFDIPGDFTKDNMIRRRLIEKLPWLSELAVVRVNVTGFLAIANQAVNYFMQQGHGHIVGISSVDAVRGSASGAVYCASKAFVSTYLEGIRNRFIQSNIPISVTDIRPGYVSTYEVLKNGYWVSTPQEAAKEIYAAIRKKSKVAYITDRWKIIGLLLKIVPDWIYNALGGF